MFMNWAFTKIRRAAAQPATTFGTWAYPAVSRWSAHRPSSSDINPACGMTRGGAVKPEGLQRALDLLQLNI